MPDVVEIECTVSTHPGIECSASEHGVITIRTNTESITIRLQQTVNKKRIPIRFFEQPVRTVESSSISSARPTIFSFAGNSGQEDTREDDYSDGGQADTDGSNTGGSNNSTSGEKKPKEPFSDEKLAELCQQLASRILEKWKSKKHMVEKNLEALRIDWSNLFGCSNYTSRGQWSYKALDTSEKFEGLQRRFHQLNLACWWNECLGRRNSGVTTRVKTHMISVLEPHFEKLGPKERVAKRKQIDRYVLQGEVISLMCARVPGLLLTASDYITTSEYDMLWKNKDRLQVLQLDWISQELIQDSKSYTESVQSMFGHMSQYLTFSRQPAPSQKISSTVSPSPTEPESGTSAASFCQRVTARSCELASSYDTSVHSRQSFEGSIEASTNATKRQKISRHATSQIEVRGRTSHENNQNSAASSLHASFADTHAEYQALDITMAANVLRSLQHSNRGYTGLAAAGLPTPDTSEFGDALQGMSDASTEGCPVLCEDSAGSVMRSSHLSASGIGRLEPDEQRFPGSLDVLPDRQASDSTLDGLAPVDRVSGVDALEPQQLQADGLFLSDFMAEYMM